MEYDLIKQVKDEPELRESFFALADRVFALPFANWYRKGCWTDSYVPYSLVRGKQVVANASVNRMEMIWRGRIRRYIQIGTVMTDEQYRNRGLARRLLQEILSDWQTESDGIFLFANDTVLDFYPRFGFCRQQEYQHTAQISGRPDAFVKLDMDREAHRRILQRLCKKGNPFSQLSTKEGYGLVMFYCDSVFRDCVYYAGSYDAVVVGMEGGGDFICFDVFCGGSEVDLRELLSHLVGEKTRRVVFGFTPVEEADCRCAPLESEDYLFVLKGKENPLAQGRMMFPLLSHA